MGTTRAPCRLKVEVGVVGDLRDLGRACTAAQLDNNPRLVSRHSSTPLFSSSLARTAHGPVLHPAYSLLPTDPHDYVPMSEPNKLAQEEELAILRSIFGVSVLVCAVPLLCGRAASQRLRIQPP